MMKPIEFYLIGFIYLKKSHGYFFKFTLLNKVTTRL